MANYKECMFNTSWDTGATVITTIAKVDMDTGKVFDIVVTEPVDEDGDEVDLLDREFINFENIPGEFEVSRGEGTDYQVNDLYELTQAFELSPGPSAPGL